MSEIQLSHVALLVPSVRKAAEYLSQFDFQIGKEEEWDGEGTREIYIERGKANSLLLMEPIKDGAYQKALSKRGPGVHHVAIDVLNLELYLELIAGTGWFLHPMSVKSIKQTQTAYLARPGFPTLIEVQEKKELCQKNETLFVNQVNFPFDSVLKRLLDPVGCAKLIFQSENGISLVLDKYTIQLKDLI